MKIKTVVVLGLGYVGLPLAVLLSRTYRVIGVDVNQRRVDELNKGKVFIDEPDFQEEFAKPYVRQNFTAKTAPEQADVFIIAVPTPVLPDKSPDLSYVDAAADAALPFLQEGNLVIIESTVPPLTAENLKRKIEEKARLKVPSQVKVAHCPERVLPGNTLYEIINNSRIIGGLDKASTDAACEVYASFVKGEIVRTDATTAEFCKLIENSFRDINIAFANELSLMAENLGIKVKEAISIANKHPRVNIHSPGIGVGGHCFEGTHGVFVQHRASKFGYNGVSFFTLQELFNRFHHSKPACELVKKAPLQGALGIMALAKNKSGRFTPSSFYHSSLLFQEKDNVLLFPQGLRVLSFDLKVKKASFRKVLAISRRNADSLLAISLHKGHTLKLTDKHPVIISNSGNGRSTDPWKIKLASEVKAGDSLILSRSIPSLHQEDSVNVIKAVLEHAPQLVSKIRVRPLQANLRDFSKELALLCPSPTKRFDFYRQNYLPLELYLQLETLAKSKVEAKLPRQQCMLLTGRGPSLNQLPAILPLDEHIARLIGYYLSEGCITEERKTARIRFTFGLGEKEYIDDVISIVKNLGMRWSIWKDPQWNNLHIKISSLLLSIVFDKVLHTGKDCYEMQIPSQLFFSTPTKRRELLKGILRGDGGVSHSDRKTLYKKNGKEYFHSNTHIDACYFTASSVLLEQVTLILLENGMLPSRGRRAGLLRISGPQNIMRLEEFFLGSKQEKIRQYLRSIRKQISYNTYRLHPQVVALKVKEITREPVSQVYSLEVEGTNTLLTNGGIIAHNCIPLDPWFLVDTDKKNTTLIQAARRINDHMPYVTAQKIEQAVASVKSPKIVTVGLSYKPNVGDVRESPAAEVVHILQQKGYDIAAYDPLIEGKQYDSLSSVIKGADCLVILVEHSVVLKELAENEKDIKLAMRTPIIMRF